MDLETLDTVLEQLELSARDMRKGLKEQGEAGLPLLQMALQETNGMVNEMIGQLAVATETTKAPASG